MSSETGGYITKLAFNNGYELPLNKDDIVVFVGPNNSGKSQSLKDIFSCCSGSELNRIVIKNIELSFHSEGLKELMEKIAINKNGSYHYMGQIVNYHDFSYNNAFNSYVGVFVSYLHTDNRLSFCVPQSNYDNVERIVHPMQLMVENSEFEKKLSSLFKSAFQEQLHCYSKGLKVSIRVGDIDDSVVKEGNRLQIANEVTKEISDLPHIENQGDGMRSFVSILLSLGFDYKRIFLIDEPESFLHQTQARIMGRMIGKELNDNQQAFISTHSTDFIKGLLEKSESRVKIVRITRQGNVNIFHTLNNHRIMEVCNDEMLKHTNLLEGLFSDRVVVCESDIDCLLYSSIEEYLFNLRGRYSEGLYLYTGGKASFKKTLSSLKELGIHYTAIFDLDVLNDEAIIKGNYNICGGDWDVDIKKDYEVLLNWINEQGDKPLTKEEALKVLTNEVIKCENNYLSPRDIKNIRSSLKIGAIWTDLKKTGREAITDSSVKNAFDRILVALKSKNIFVVPCGEIESFIPSVGGHSHGWLQDVFKTYPLLDDPAYSKVTEFVKEYANV